MRGVPSHEVSYADIEHGINEIIRRCPGEHWTPRDIYRALRNERCFMFKDDDGFFIVDKCIDPYSTEHYLNVWLMWFKPGKFAPRRQEIYAMLDQICRDWRCEWIQFASPREAWDEMTEGDFKKTYTIWRRHVHL